MEMTIIKNEATEGQFKELQWLVKGGWLNERLVKNLSYMVNAGEATIHFKEIDPSKMLWDGEIIVKFAKKPDVVKVVNSLISWARADEVSMENTKTLRLWWD